MITEFEEIIRRLEDDLHLDPEPEVERQPVPGWAVVVAVLGLVVAVAAILAVLGLWHERQRINELERLVAANTTRVQQNADAAEQLRDGLDKANGRLKAAGEPQVSVTAVPVVGPAGAIGAPGPMGPAGVDGVDGSPGATGAAGPAGASGADGQNGTDGKDGAQGPAGPAGADGAPGVQGPTGAPGRPPAAIVIGNATCTPDTDPTPGAAPTYTCVLG
jgi:hypothetical protein